MRRGGRGLCRPDSALTANNGEVWSCVQRVRGSVRDLPVWIAVILDGSVPQPSPPRVELVQPKPNASYQAPTDILLVAQVSDADGWVEQVEFYANGELIGRQAADPVLCHGPAERQGFR